jgi:hypothetical protein
MDWPLEVGGWDVQQAWVQSAAHDLAWGIFGWGVGVAILLLVASWAIQIRRRGFWCAQAQREVEVEFEERGLPGFRRPTAVLSCSVFDPPTAVHCRRRCLDGDMRAPIAGN